MLVSKASVSSHRLSTTTRYFPGLNGLRFFAAFVVSIHHIEWAKTCFGLPSLFFNRALGPAVIALGPVGVTFFFTLSGFLITYLLLEELGQSGEIEMPYFYGRRILRIWPNYFLLVILGLVILPHFLTFGDLDRNLSKHYVAVTTLYLLFLGQVEPIVYGTVPYLGVLWSVGVEEQFYFVWPFLIRKFRDRQIYFFAIFIGTFVVMRYWIEEYPPALSHRLGRQIAWVFDRSQFECMASGGLAAYLFFKRYWRVLRWLYAPGSQIAALVTILYCVSRNIELRGLHWEIYGLAFAVLILNVATNRESVVKAENKVFEFLGKISYGWYLFHQIFISLCIHALKRMRFHGAQFESLLYFGTLSLTFLFSSAVYLLYERKILALKAPLHDFLLSRRAMNREGPVEHA